MPRHRTPRSRLAAVAIAVTAAALLLAGCDDAGGLESAGPTPTAVGPVRLWPELPEISAPPIDYGENHTERVDGIAVPGGDVHAVDPVAVVRADVAAHPGQVTGPDGLSEQTARQIRECGTEPGRCPVLKPYYRDLTGDGRDELIVGITVPEQQTAIRVYMPEKGGLTRIMSDTEAIVGVELAGRDLIVRAVSAGIPGYEYRTVWSWDGQQRAMLPARDEIVHVGSPRPAPDPSADTP
ncbi:hypothetical protein E3E14_12055 [Streptomyces sp. ICN441]|uniref:Lipoprotein n=1 Tax=Streptomyces tirandamycinicus TaxID=2174846 RepID=A0A2S1SX03_9ACTN|nr:MULTISPECIES: hypothetical protein [Streptomyces]AWI30943.1 hypothetical protein DDW44_20805 [Streptomyces tirandamycinicus]TFE52307.1 hypothetical protein E3E14_12055 [Streptomyces sp. ICN441]